MFPTPKVNNQWLRVKCSWPESTDFTWCFSHQCWFMPRWSRRRSFLCLLCLCLLPPAHAVPPNPKVAVDRQLLAVVGWITTWQPPVLSSPIKSQKASKWLWLVKPATKVWFVVVATYCIWYYDVNTVVFAAARLAHGPFPFSTIPMTVQSASILLLQGSPTKQIGALAAMPIFVWWSDGEPHPRCIPADIKGWLAAADEWYSLWRAWRWLRPVFQQMPRSVLEPTTCLGSRNDALARRIIFFGRQIAVDS